MWVCCPSVGQFNVGWSQCVYQSTDRSMNVVQLLLMEHALSVCQQVQDFAVSESGLDASVYLSMSLLLLLVVVMVVVVVCLFVCWCFLVVFFLVVLLLLLLQGMPAVEESRYPACYIFSPTLLECPHRFASKRFPASAVGCFMYTHLQRTLFVLFFFFLLRHSSRVYFKMP